MTPVELVVAGTAVVLLSAALLWVASPLWRGAPAALVDDPRVIGLLVEREAVLATLRDLDDDARDGRLTPQSHAVMRAEALSRGAAVLAALDGVIGARSGDARTPWPHEEDRTARIEADIARARERLDGGP